MRTFYVEDELRVIFANLGIVADKKTIVADKKPIVADKKPLFESLLNESDRKKVREIINDAENHNDRVDVKNICELFNTHHPRLTIMTDFKLALTYICEMDQDERTKYGLFIFDRNLLGQEGDGEDYLLEEIQKIDEKFTKQDYEYCHQDVRESCREGDYLLRRIFYLLKNDGVSVGEIGQKVYILSAFPEKETRNEGPLRDLFEQGCLTSKNYIDKDNEKEENKEKYEMLRQLVVRNEKYLKISSKYSHALDFFRAHDNGNEDVNTIVDCLGLDVRTKPNEIEEKIHKIHKIYKKYGLRQKIDAQTKEVDNAWKLEIAKNQGKKIDRGSWKTTWYCDHKPTIPENIVDMGNFVKDCRNNEEHNNDYAAPDYSNLDLTVFTLWAQIMALFEVARFFYEKDQ